MQQVDLVEKSRMALESVKNADVTNNVRWMTHKQGQVLYRFTSLKFWEPVHNPQPSIEQASHIVGMCFDLKTSLDGKEGKVIGGYLEEAIQIWFPDWTILKFRANSFFQAKKKDGGDHHHHEDHTKDQPHQQQQQQQQPQPQQPQQESNQQQEQLPRWEDMKKEPPKEEKKQDTPKPKPLPPKKQEFKPGDKVNELLALINSGLKNLWMVGPAGCGKTTIAKQVSELLEVPCTVISCGMGTSASEFLGYKYPSREGTPFGSSFGQPSVIVLDEFTTLDAAVAQIANSALANGEIHTTTGTVQRHENCIIIATSNTKGDGADRQYVSNNQLDAATKDRFVGGIVEVDYSPEFETQYDSQVCSYVWKLREIIKSNGLRRIASTRAIQAAHAMKTTGITDWKARIICDWSDNEKQLVKC